MKLGRTILKIREREHMSQEEFSHVSCDKTNYFKLGKRKELP